jgi:hypothetical protein
VDVETAVGGKAQYLRGEDLTEGGHDDHVWIPGPEAGHGRGVAEILRLEDGQAAILSGGLDGRLAKLAPTPCRSVRLREDAEHRVCFAQRF